MEKILYARSNRRTIEAGLLCAAALYLQFVSMRRGVDGGLLIVLLCLFFAVERTLGFIPGASFLKLDAQGFTACHWFRETRYSWTDIDQFKVVTTRYMGIIPVWRYVGLSYAKTSSKRNLAVRIVGAIIRYDALLPNTYGMKAKDLAVLLDQWRLGAVAAEPPPLPWVSSSWQGGEMPRG